MTIISTYYEEPKMNKVVNFTPARKLTTKTKAKKIVSKAKATKKVVKLTKSQLTAKRIQTMLKGYTKVQRKSIMKAVANA